MYLKNSKRKLSSVLSKTKAGKYTSVARPVWNIRLDISKRLLASANFLFVADRQPVPKQPWWPPVLI